MASSEVVVVLVTGANSGVGYAIAQVLSQQSSPTYHVILAGRSLDSVTTATTTLRDCPDTKGTVSPLHLDLTSESSISAAAEKVSQDFGRLDALINNAGIYIKRGNSGSGAISDGDASLATELNDTFATNVTGTAMVTEAFEPLLLKGHNPYLLFISSGLGSLGLAGDKSGLHYKVDTLGYRVSKAALNMLVVQKHKMLGGDGGAGDAGAQANGGRKKGVKVFAVCPGLVTSNLRGKSEQQRSAGGAAGDPIVSGELILEILKGRRDDHVGGFVHKDGVYPW